jgi:hypothetical protein
MKRTFWALLVVLLVATGTSVQSQCPQFDNGLCDSLNVMLYKLDNVGSTPMFATVPLLVTHDQTDPIDSLSGFVIPLRYTSSNSSAYCSVSGWWNNTTLLYMIPDFPRSIFRHLVTGTDTIHNRMADLAAAFLGQDWGFMALTLDGTSEFLFNITHFGGQDQYWWEGDRVLLATMTFIAEETTTVCIDTAIAYPAWEMNFFRSDAEKFYPKHNMPFCFLIGTDDVQTIGGLDDSRPSEFSLSQNYPNPFNPVTNIRFTVIKTSQVKLEVFNIVGQKVKTLVNEEMQPGIYSADWEGKDESGNFVSSGIYFYRMQADQFTDMKKMVLVK